jgi:hypothetical protein
MELITILNRCHRFRGFVYQRAHFSANKKSIEVTVRPRKGSVAACSRCHSPAPGYDQLAERRFELIPLWGFFVFLLYTTLRGDWPLRDVVDECIVKWCARHERKPEDMELLMAFSHLHSDHYAALAQFTDRPNTRYMGLTHEEMVGFWGMTNYPEQRVALDLGGRKILIWDSPGHVISEFAYYDTYTQILFTGDMFYRGRCYITYWDKWFDSMKRLMDFLDTHQVAHVVGCHVECSRTGEDYPYGMAYQPDEAPMHLTVAELRNAFEVAKTITKPGIYFTGSVYLCNQTRGTTTIDKNPYRYD